MIQPIKIETPFNDAIVLSLKAGDIVSISGVIYTARDAAHKRLCALIAEGKPLPLELSGQVIYFSGPSPAAPGHPVGSAGPTTSYRMDAYSPILIRKAGLKGMIGKGNRSIEVIEAMKECKCVYFAATGGAGALLSKCITASETVCYEDLGAEAIHRFTVKDFPAITAIDCYGNNLYALKP
ncbi:MAG: fumarate hydratase [Lentisphaerae bacterium GWF2_44_16]|nr:MAG: fumarate hydratase [Lentisphaerae bacterium GWF2_44_16]